MLSWRFLTPCALIVLCGLPGIPRAIGAEPIFIGADRQLFVDRLIIEQMAGTTLQLHRPVRREKVLMLDKPWEGKLSSYPNVIFDKGKIRMWYRGWGNAITKGQVPWKSRYTCYAESADGVHWQRPVLGICEFAGSKKNNLVFTDPQFANVCVFKDDNPATPVQERYKAVARSAGMKPSKIFAAVSEDGVHWQRLQRPLFVERPGETYDGAPNIFWDGRQRRYICYFRGHRPPGAKQTFRAIKVSTSPDFRRWEPLEYIDIGEPWCEQFYTTAGQLYYRGPYHLLFPKRFVVDRKAIKGWAHEGLSDIVFLAGRDGKHFTRLFHDAFIRPGLDRNNWHERALVAGPSWVPTADGEMSAYIVENFRTDQVHVRRHTLREDGFVSVQAPDAGGELITKLLLFKGGELTMNYSTSAAGDIGVEIQDADGRAIEGFALDDCPPVFGDEIDHVVRWKSGSDLSAFAGRPVRLRFVMRDADLFSICFR
jgi:hypothetical protein